MKKNLIIEKAFRYKPNSSNIKDPDGCVYDEKMGCWINENNKTPMVLDSTISKPRTKKADIETGEDQKGE